MNENVIGCSPAECKKQINRQILLCVVLGVVTLGLNVLLTAVRTEGNHTVMLILNILADTLYCWFLLYYISSSLLRRHRLLQLMLRVKTPLEGAVEEIRPETTRYMYMECWEVMVAGRRYFLPTKSMSLQPGEVYRLSIVANVIVEAVQ